MSNDEHALRRQSDLLAAAEKRTAARLLDIRSALDEITSALESGRPTMMLGGTDVLLGNLLRFPHIRRRRSKR